MFRHLNCRLGNHDCDSVGFAWMIHRTIWEGIAHGDHDCNNASTAETTHQITWEGIADCSRIDLDLDINCQASMRRGERFSCALRHGDQVSCRTKQSEPMIQSSFQKFHSRFQDRSEESESRQLRAQEEVKRLLKPYATAVPGGAASTMCNSVRGNIREMEAS